MKITIGYGQTRLTKYKKTMIIKDKKDCGAEIIIEKNRQKLQQKS